MSLYGWPVSNLHVFLWGMLGGFSYEAMQTVIAAQYLSSEELDESRTVGIVVGIISIVLVLSALCGLLSLLVLGGSKVSHRPQRS
jgi:hypothetical protein